ncbi:helix-turn-helix domain-containing protein [Streptococcus sp. VTCC 12905]|uniref:helix-turn-helix domain-containing protein n=1 Tax=Streptococcus sp. VTCC 12905 TaxID=3413768 RepID=UPI003D9C74C5
MARPKYQDWLTEDGLTLMGGWARSGLSEEQIASNMGIARSTLNEWKKKHSDISDTLKKNKEVADMQVENALFENAKGFYYKEDVVTNQGDVVTLTKYSKPNVTAQIFWVKNRMPDKWRDKQEIEQTTRTIEIKVGEWDADED